MKLSDNNQIPTPLRTFTFVALLTGTLAIGISGCSSSAPTPKAGSSTEATSQAEPPPTIILQPAPAEPAVVMRDAPGDTPVAAEDLQVRDAQIEEVVVTGSYKKGRRDRQNRAERRVSRAQAPAALQSIASSIQHFPGHPVPPPVYRPLPNGEKYPAADDNPVRQVASHPVSTFSIDVDTAAYANTRRTINSGRLPNRDAVRVEEFINYFNYSYAQPDHGDTPFSVTTEVGPSPWNNDRKLMLVGLQGYDVDRSELPPANLVFLIDVSGSMNNPNKLGLLKSSMKMLTRQLRPQDTISIAVYAGAAGQVLEPTPGNERRKILAAIDALHAGGSTNGGAGINLAYALAEQELKNDGINRVILATDGDFNVGTSDTKSLGRLIEQKRKTGVSLTVLGFGAGNYNDSIMQELAQKGNGNAAYIDTLNEARKVLVDEMGSTLKTIAKDVKIQVEFNPALVSEYRLIGYETRHLNREDFNNDKIDAGEIGAGHSVTALYELTLTDATRPSVDKLRYGTESSNVSAVNSTTELAHVKLRYKAPNGTTSKLLQQVVSANAIEQRLGSTSENYKFAAAASAYGQLLRGSNYTGTFNYMDALKLARSARGQDEYGYRREFESLLRTTAALQGNPADNPERISMR